MANKAFLLPVVIDETGDDDENVPDKFREVQWTRLPAGKTPSAFVERIQRLLSGEMTAVHERAPSPAARSRAICRPRAESSTGVRQCGTGPLRQRYS